MKKAWILLLLSLSSTAWAQEAGTPSYGTVNPPLNYQALRQRVESAPAYERLKKVLATLDNDSLLPPQPKNEFDYKSMLRYVEKYRKNPPPIKDELRTVYPNRP